MNVSAKCRHIVVLSALLGCSSAPPPAPAATPPAAAAEPSPSAAAPRVVAPPPRPLPLEEDEEGLIGAPDDETSFDFDPESADEAPANVVLDGTPSPPRSIVRALAPYLEVRRARIGGIPPKADRMVVLTRLTETTQVHLLLGPGAARQQVTFGSEPIEQVALAPGRPETIATRTDVRGDEQYQINVLDLQTRAGAVVTPADSRHGPLRWAPDGSRIAFTGNARNGTDMDVYLAAQPFADPPIRVAELTGQNVVLGWDRGGRQLVVQHFRSKIESGIRLVNVRTGHVQDVVPAQTGISNSSATFAPSGKSLYIVSNREGDNKDLFELDLATGSWKRLTRDAPWDIEEIATSADGRSIVYNRNEDGASVLRQLDVASGKSRKLGGIPKGVISAIRFVGNKRLGMTLSTPTRPPDAYTYDLAERRLVRWTFSEVGGILPSAFVEPEVIRVRSFDGLEVPALVYRPRGEGPFPVLLWMHGGPEEQSRPSFDPVIQYFVARGVVVIAPNVRGSDGYGRRYLSLDDGTLREDAVRDVGALLDWIGAQPDLNADRVGIHGASYGGFMVLASLVAYSDRIRAGCDVVGLSNIVTFLKNTGDYRRDLRRVEYGDERVVEVKQFLHSISPLTNADRIRSALFVAHGARDPRVPASEAEQIVDAVRNNGVDVWYMLATEEGHSFRKRRTRDVFYRLMATFFAKHLLDETVSVEPDRTEQQPESEVTVTTEGAPGGEQSEESTEAQSEGEQPDSDQP